MKNENNNWVLLSNSEADRSSAYKVDNIEMAQDNISKSLNVERCNLYALADIEFVLFDRKFTNKFNEFKTQKDIDDIRFSINSNNPIDNLNEITSELDELNVAKYGTSSDVKKFKDAQKKKKNKFYKRYLENNKDISLYDASLEGIDIK